MTTSFLAQLSSVYSVEKVRGNQVLINNRFQHFIYTAAHKIG